MDRIKVLRQKKHDLITEAEALLEKQAGDEGLTEEEEARYSEIEAELTKLEASIAREERLMEARRSMGTEPATPATPAADPETSTSLIPAAPKEDPNEKKFATLGEQLQAIAAAGMNKGGDRDSRLIWGAATGAGEAVPSDGGFLVQQDFRTDLMGLMHDLGDVVSRTRSIPISAGSNGLKMPAIDESSRVDGSRWGGVLAYWANEADTVTASKPKFREINMELKKLFGLGYATEELLRDATALGAIMRQAFAEELTFKTEDAIINGVGNDQPLGLLNSGAVITVAKDSGQAAATITTTNILNMFARLPRRSARNAVWLINQDTLPQLWQLTLGSGTAVVLLYQPPGVNGPNANAPFGTLLGRPVLPVEYCATLGTAGDIILADLSQYLMIDKDGVQADSSMHVRFIYDEMTFRFIYRVDGQPAWKQPVTPKNGTNTQSPFITLATRA